MRRAAVWRGIDEPRMEIARIDRRAGAIFATGTQVGRTYELQYELDGERLRLEVVGERSADVRLEGRDYFDLGFSPLFNSLPIWRDDVLDRRDTRDYVMRFVSVPDLQVSDSPQTYEPLGERRLRYRAGNFAAELQFDDDGLVVIYEGLAERVG